VARNKIFNMMYSMKHKLSTFIICFILTLTVTAQLNYSFLGEYETERLCISISEPADWEVFDMHFEEINLEGQNLEELEYYSIEMVSPGRYSNELTVNLNNNYLVNAQILTDSTFIIRTQLIENAATGNMIIEGEGKVVEDSLVLYCKFSYQEGKSCKIVGYKKDKEEIDNQYTYPIPAKNAEWGMVTFYGSPSISGAGNKGSIYRYDGKDTLIKNQVYQHWAGIFTRYDDNKLYKIDLEKSSISSIYEEVYYDFNLAEKDSFLIPHWNTYAFVSRVYEFTTLNGQKRKEIILQMNSTTCGNRLRWIEGIGDVANGLFYTNQIGLCNISNSIVCFSDSSGNVYKEAYFNHPCDSIDTYTDIINNIDEITYNTEITIFPNPAQHRLNVAFSNGLKSIPHNYIIYNLNGTEILKAQFNHNIKNIDIKHLKSGTYLIHFLKDDVSIASGRFVKME